VSKPGVSKADLLMYEAQGNRIGGLGVEHYKKLHENSSQWYASRFASFLPANKSEPKCVDVPCGEGNILYFLKKLGFTHVKGWDIDANRVKIAKSLGLQADIGDAWDCLEELSDIDVFFTVDFVEHLEKEEAVEFLIELSKTLKEGGILLIRTPITDSIFGGLHLYNDFTHKWAVNSNVWKTIATATGYKFVEIVDERPVVDSPKHFLTRVIFDCFRFIVTMVCKLFLLPVPQVWSPSVWIILQK
jgi:SAM-dependent methyltransferase